MTDLTVLVSPMPLHPVPGNFTFGRRSYRAQNRPIMVTLETEVDEEADKEKPIVESPINGDFLDPPTSPPRRARTPKVAEPNLLAPPVNTWKSRPRHRPTRSQSAPPERRVAPPVEVPVSEEDSGPRKTVFYQESLGFKQRNPNRSFTAFNLNRQTNQGGELVRPPPPLLRPTTFWRKTKRSGVTGASYSPASHLIRRSTYIAAGLAFDAPVHDLSALCVESRMWVQGMWVIGSIFLLVLAAGVANSSYSAISPTSSHFPENRNVHQPPPRQLTPPIPTNPTATSTTFDFWWPFPAAATTTSPVITVPIAPVASVIAASSAPRTESSIGSGFSSVSSNVFAPPSINTSATSSTASSSSSTHSISSTPAPASNAVSKAPLKLSYLIPVVSGVGVILLAFAIWVLYGCCTRRPRVRTDDGELICGPPYVGNNENDARRDIEHQDHDWEDIGMLEIPKRGRRGFSGQFRWPSFNEPPSFDPVKGFYVPDEYKEGDEDYCTASLLAPPTAGNGRSKSSRTQRSAVTKRSAGAGPSGAASIFSDATSVALLDMYESDEEAEHKRRAEEIPWESLRHKSIKRGILEQVKKENKWMDSIRGSIASGSAFLSGRGYSQSKGEDEERSAPDHEDEDGQTRDKRPFGRRRGHVRADSDLFIGSINPSSSGVPTAELSGNPVMPLKPSKAKELPDESTKPTPGVRRGFARLKDDPDDIDKYTPLPTRSAENRSKSRNRSRTRSRSSSPVKKSSASIGSRPVSREVGARPFSREILPNNPPQIMSPPLESQMCFTPIPPLMDVMLSPKSRTRSKSTSGKGNLPAKTTTLSRKMRKLHAPTPPLLPFPGGDGLTSPRPEAYRGRLVKKKTSGPFGSGTASLHKKLPARPPQDETSNACITAEGDEALRKVDKIMESSWGARDLGDEAIRCLSPTGFGEQVY